MSIYGVIDAEVIVLQFINPAKSPNGYARALRPTTDTITA